MSRPTQSFRSRDSPPPPQARVYDTLLPPTPFGIDPSEAASIALAYQLEADELARREYEDHLLAVEYGHDHHPDRSPASPAAAPTSPANQGSLLEELLALQAHQDRLVALELNRQHNMDAQMDRPPLHHAAAASISPPPTQASLMQEMRTIEEQLAALRIDIEDVTDVALHPRWTENDVGHHLHHPHQFGFAVGLDGLDPDNMTYEEMLALDEHGGNVKRERWREISGQVLSTLPTHRWTTNSREDVVCSICLSGYVRGDVARTLPCTHVFHDECASPWVRDNNSCPVCMREIHKS